MSLDLNVEDYLRSKNLQVYRAGSNQLTTQCLWHDDSNHKKGKLYINAEHGAFDCKVCGQAGGLRMLMEQLGDEVDESAPAFKPSRKFQIYGEYSHLTRGVLTGNSKAMDYLLERGLSVEVIEKARIGYHPRGRSILDDLPSRGHAGGFTNQELEDVGLRYDSGKEVFEGCLVIPYLNHGQVVQVRRKDMAGKYATPSGEPVRLYNQDALRSPTGDPVDVVFLVEGEFDALMLQDCFELSPDVKLRNMAVVAVPGTQALPGGKEKFAALFEEARRVYIGFDTDNAGRRGAMSVKELLGQKARIVELPEEDLDWNDYLGPKSPTRPHGGHGWRDVKELIAITDDRDKRLLTVRDAARRLKEIEESAPALKLGYPSLDALIAPGLRPGSVTVPLARTGNGKSILIQNMMYNTRHVPSMCITLELTAAETWVRLRRIARFHNPTMSDEQLEDMYENLRICDENSLRKKDLDQLAEEFAEDHGQRPQIGFVDYLGYYARAQPGDSPYMKVSNAIMSLKEWAKEYELACIVPGQVNRSAKPGEPISEDSARDAGPVEETADFLFGIWRPWEADEIVTKGARPGAVEDTLKLRILKSRHGNKGKTIDLAMGHHSLAIVDRIHTAQTHRIELENQRYNRGETYQEYWKSYQQNAIIAAQGTLRLAEEKPPWE